MSMREVKMDKEIRDAVEWVEDEILTLKTYMKDSKFASGNGHRVRYALKSYSILISLAERYLEVGMPEKKQFNTEPEFFQKDSNCDFNYVNGYNQALDDYRLWLAKRLEGIVEVITRAFEEVEAPSQSVYSKDIADAIRKHLGVEQCLRKRR